MTTLTHVERFTCPYCDQVVIETAWPETAVNPQTIDDALLDHCRALHPVRTWIAELRYTLRGGR